ncbi:serine/threonine-protein kinase gin4 [Rhodotorula sphaerocarpa]
MVEILRAPTPQPSERHGRNPFRNLSSPPRTPSPKARGASKHPRNAATDPHRASEAVARRIRPATGEEDWYRFKAPTKEDEQRAAPLLDLETRRRFQFYDRVVSRQTTRWSYKMLGEWRIGEFLGKGSSGQVRLARSTATGDFAAVKRVSRWSDNDRHAQAIHREISVMKLVSAHPHFVRLFDVYENPWEYYIVMEYTPLGELFNHVHQNIILPHATHRYFTQLMSAVAYLARFRIAHRDIKLENIMLFRDDEGDLSIKLIDLGMAAYQPEGELLMTCCGSPHYAAPEIMEGVPYDGSKSDIWSCGVVLYALIARTLPFDDDDIPTLLEKVRIGEYEMLPIITGHARDLIRRCLTKDPRHRISLPVLLSHPYMREHGAEADQIPVLADDAERRRSLRNLASMPSTASAASVLLQLGKEFPSPNHRQSLGPCYSNQNDHTLHADPPLAFYDPEEPLVDLVVEDVALLVTAGDVPKAEKLIRAGDSCARLFYLSFLGFQQPELVEEVPKKALVSCFESSGPSSASTRGSSASTRRSASAPLAAFPLPPARSTSPSLHLSLLYPRRSSSGPAQVVPEDISLEDPSTGRSWQEINQQYTFPAAAPPSNDVPVEVASTAEVDFLPPASAPPQLESFNAEPLPISPNAMAFLPPSHRPSSLLTSRPLSPQAAIHSLPVSPSLVQSPQSGDRQQQLDEKNPSRLRGKVSIQQRLRSIFRNQHTRTQSLGNAVKVTGGSAVAANADDASADGRSSRVRWSISSSAGRKEEQGEPNARVPSPTPSRRSSLLKRSDAYSSFTRALGGKPPVSPELQRFGAILELGASRPAGGLLNLREVSRRKPAFHVYEDPFDMPDGLETPRASSQSRPVQVSDDEPLQPGAEGKGWRLLRKASSHVVGRVLSVRQPGASRPASAAFSASTGHTGRAASDLPTVTVGFAKAPARGLASGQGGAFLQHGMPWRSSTTSLHETSDRHPSRWRRASLSIRVPSISPRRTDVLTQESPAFDLCTPTLEIRQDLRDESLDGNDLQRVLRDVQAENARLRQSLLQKDHEVDLLRAREETLAECLATGNKMVRELSEERDEYEERLRRISWYSSGGDPDWLRVRNESVKSRESATRGGSEAQWLSGSRRSRFEDEVSA